MKTSKPFSILFFLLLISFFCFAQQSETEAKSQTPNGKTPVRKTAAGKAPSIGQDNTAKPEKAKAVLVTDMDGNNMYSGLDYIKNFRVGTTNFRMDKKLEQSDKWMLHLIEADRRLDLEIYYYTKEENNYKINYSLCYMKNILFLINLNISPNDAIGAANIQPLLETIKFKLGYAEVQIIDNAMCWKYEDYFATIKKDISVHDVTFINIKTGQKFLSLEKTYKYNSGYNSH
ncbi:MAG: hypothetical protein Q7U54_19585 [Bacteroidales bacterium]|nr:hypothetical protein [Bacteroidales bacterium]